jgi:hypothetical protein
VKKPLHKSEREKSLCQSKQERFVSTFPGPLLPRPEVVCDCLRAREGDGKEAGECWRKASAIMF